MNKLRIVALLVLVLGVFVTVVFGWPWSDDMVTAPTIRPYEKLLLPPRGTLPVVGGEIPIPRIEGGDILKNPTQATPESIERGKQLFMIYCTACHGVNADGKGLVAAKLQFKPADLHAEFVRGRTDGYLYGTIRHGGMVMPTLGGSISPDESWAIVNYIRSIQQ